MRSILKRHPSAPSRLNPPGPWFNQAEITHSPSWFNQEQITLSMTLDFRGPFLPQPSRHPKESCGFSIPSS